MYMTLIFIMYIFKTTTLIIRMLMHIFMTAALFSFFPCIMSAITTSVINYFHAIALSCSSPCLRNTVTCFMMVMHTALFFFIQICAAIMIMILFITAQTTDKQNKNPGIHFDIQSFFLIICKCIQKVIPLLLYIFKRLSGYCCKFFYIKATTIF